MSSLMNGGKLSSDKYDSRAAVSGVSGCVQMGAKQKEPVFHMKHSCLLFRLHQSLCNLLPFIILSFLIIFMSMIQNELYLQA